MELGRMDGPANDGQRRRVRDLLDNHLVEELVACFSGYGELLLRARHAEDSLHQCFCRADRSLEFENWYDLPGHRQFFGDFSPRPRSYFVHLWWPLKLLARSWPLGAISSSMFFTRLAACPFSVLLADSDPHGFDRWC